MLFRGTTLHGLRTRAHARAVPHAIHPRQQMADGDAGEAPEHKDAPAGAAVDARQRRVNPQPRHQRAVRDAEAEQHGGAHSGREQRVAGRLRRVVERQRRRERARRRPRLASAAAAPPRQQQRFDLARVVGAHARQVQARGAAGVVDARVSVAERRLCARAPRRGRLRGVLRAAAAGGGPVDAEECGRGQVQDGAGSGDVGSVVGARRVEMRVVGGVGADVWRGLDGAVV